MPENLYALIARLDDTSGDGEDAKFQLIDLGRDVVPVLADRVAGVGRFGKLSAIEVFEALNDTRACPALIALLADQDETVVEWSAGALGAIGCRRAVEPLRKLQARMIADQVSPDWTGLSTVRYALTALGVRQPVMPPLVQRAEWCNEGSGRGLFRSSDLAAVCEELTEHKQVLLSFMLWRVDAEGCRRWIPGRSEGWRFDWSASWLDNVASSRTAIRREVAAIEPATDVLAQISWIDETDVTTETEASPES